MKEQLTIELSSVIPSELVKELLENYEKVLVEYRKGKWEDSLLIAGRFVENVFRILHYLRSGEVVKEIESIQDEVNALQKESKLDESVRVVIPRIAVSFPYTLRSKREVAHVKPVSPTYIDATLSITACDWIIAELIRLYHTSDENKILEIINKLVSRKVPFIERHGNQTFVTKRLSCKGEILLLLLDSPDGLGRNDLGKILGKHYTQSTITEALQELEEDRLIVYSENAKRYYITGPGETEITNILAKVV
jgi:hypothetical protein